MKGAIAILLMAVLQSTMSDAAAVDPKTFFPGAEKNLTNITWAHAVNSKELLTAKLNDATVMMLEADVVMGKKADSKPTDPEVPIMAHPPAITSDLTLQEFVETVDKHTGKKGVKLDFKTAAALKNSTEILKTLNNAKYPVFINADILVGPVGGAAPGVSPEAFLEGVKDLKNLGLSPGWTTNTKDASNATLNGTYTDVQVTSMISALKGKVDAAQPVTYAVRAVFAVGSAKQLKQLVEDKDVKGATLTIWSSEDDVVNATELSTTIKDIGVEKVFIDVPAALKSKMSLNGASGLAVTTMTLLGSLFVNFFLTVIPRRG